MKVEIHPLAKTKARRLSSQFKHGWSQTPEFRAWRSMRSRCSDPRSHNYKHYGARGIRVCERWQGSFLAFLEDVGPRPGLEYSIERIDNDGNYEPGNCRWATIAEQNRNRTDSVILEFNGKRQTQAEWAREVGMGEVTLACRLKAGWSVADAITRPVEPRTWTERSRQGLRLRAKRLIEFQGLALQITEWSRRMGISKTTLRDRLARGWSAEQALTTPVDRRTAVNSRENRARRLRDSGRQA